MQNSPWSVKGYHSSDGFIDTPPFFSDRLRFDVDQIYINSILPEVSNSHLLNSFLWRNTKKLCKARKMQRMTPKKAQTLTQRKWQRKWQRMTLRRKAQGGLKERRWRKYNGSCNGRPKQNKAHKANDVPSSAEEGAKGAQMRVGRHNSRHKGRCKRRIKRNRMEVL